MFQGLSQPFAARVLAVQALYQAAIKSQVQIKTVTTDPQIDRGVDQVIDEFLGPAKADRMADIGAVIFDERMFSDLVKDAYGQLQQLDDLILGVLNESWQIERLDPVLLALLRVASHEIGQANVKSPKKLISQYVQIAEGFFSGKESALVNATLDALGRGLHPGAFDG